MMKVLVVSSYNANCCPTYVVEQMNALQSLDVKMDYFGVKGIGVIGYLSNLNPLLQKIREFQPDIIHAHYGLCGLLANLQRKVPVITTYHGSDINSFNILPLSRVAMWLSQWNIFVSQKLIAIAHPQHFYSCLPCGIDTNRFVEYSKIDARKKLGWKEDFKYVLFAGAFERKVKNAILAKEAISIYNSNLPNSKRVLLIELRGYTRDEIIFCMNAADVLLMTSFTEGSPQVIKEAMACSCPVVSVDVGDVVERIKAVKNSYITKRNAQDIADKLHLVLDADERTNGREQLLKEGLDNKTIAQRLVNIYRQIINKNL